jgi:hypothetical protein
MNTKSRRRCWFVSFVVLASGLVFWNSCIRGGPIPKLGLPASRPALEMVRLLLEAEVEDEPNWDRRNNFISSHITGLAGQSIWQRAFPVRYASERVFLLGREAVDPLLAIAGNPAANPRVAKTAWYILVEFDDPRIRGRILSQLKASTMTPFDAAWFLNKHLPIASSSNLLSSSPVAWGDLIEKLLEETKDLSYEDLCLRLLDECMKSELDVEMNSGQIERWLDLRYDQDIDEWLADKAPDALAFRNRELARGYDPVVSFSRLCMATGIVDEGFKAVFADQDSRESCHRLLDAVYGDVGNSPMQIPSTEGWQKRVREWYAQHRSELRYDRDKHRFIIGGPSTLPALRQ